jgi:hypothetical protein
MMPMLKHFGVGVIPWGPLGAGREWCVTYRPELLLIRSTLPPRGRLASHQAGPEPAQRRPRQAGKCESCGVGTR